MLRPHPSQGATEPPHCLGGVQNTRAQITGSSFSLIPTHQYIDVLLLREEGTHFLHISAKDGLDQGRLQGEPAFKERAGAELGVGGWGGGDTWFDEGRRWRGSARGSWLQGTPAVCWPVARPPRTPAWLRGARRGAGREPREPRARAQPRPHIPGLAWRLRRAQEGGSGQGLKG